MEQLEKSEDEFHSGMNKVFKSMENISSCIFFSCILVLLLVLVSILAQLVNQQQKTYRPPFSSPSSNHQAVPQYGHPSQRNVQNENQGKEQSERVYETYHDCPYFNFQ